MREIRTLRSMSGGGKRDVGFVPQVTAPTFELYHCGGSAPRRTRSLRQPLRASYRGHPPGHMSKAGALRRTGGAGSRRLLPASSSVLEGCADLLAPAVLRSSTLHFAQPALQPPKPLETGTGSDSVVEVAKFGRPLTLQ